MLRARLRAVLWVLLAALCVPANGRAQSAAPLSLLDVPFISQSELLCGGAAAAMVLRYWGERGIDASAFESLVDRRAGGIRAGALIDNLRSRGWSAVGLAGSSEALARELDGGRPPVTLIEDRPGTFHYIVVVGLTSRAVVFHDPARTPFRVMSRDEFDRRWASADRWMGIVVPDPSRQPVAAPPTRAATSDDSCDGIVTRGVMQAQANDLDAATRTLTSALACRGPAALRELAGVRLLQKQWIEVSALASAALIEDPRDQQAWRLLATSRFVQDDRRGALEAWNEVGEPRVDLLRVEGLAKTRQRVVEHLVDVPPNALLTPGLFTRTRRRLRDLPSASSSQLEYVPVTAGLAELRARVFERPVLPDDRIDFAMIGVNAVFRRQVEVSIGTLTGGGDRLTIGWRFWPGRPRVSASFTAPAPWGGIWGVDVFNERQPFKDDVLPIAHRKGAHLSGSIWPAHWMRLGAIGGIEHWRSSGDFGVGGGGLRMMTQDDRVDARLDLSRWIGTGSAQSFGTVEAAATFRSSIDHRGRVWVARGGAAAATVATPPDIWFAGDTGRARGVPLRAHPVIDGGRLDTVQTGRRLQYVSGEVQQWWSYRTKAQIGAAAFVDTVRVNQRLELDPKTDVDVGVGLRLSAPGFGGVLRIDVAHGLRDGDDAISFVFEP
ncbi:MAG TPA: papain-like cysteine protease family protein [Vicinamibacterales bacterium]|nr:papain-like cysteine protease family protein [Vicinamibacterales bacterium]